MTHSKTKQQRTILFYSPRHFLFLIVILTCRVVTPLVSIRQLSIDLPRTFVSHSWGEAFEDFALTLHRLLDEEVPRDVREIDGMVTLRDARTVFHSPLKRM